VYAVNVVDLCGGAGVAAVATAGVVVAAVGVDEATWAVVVEGAAGVGAC
jgi:hypothetical protein